MANTIGVTAYSKRKTKKAAAVMVLDDANANCKNIALGLQNIYE